MVGIAAAMPTIRDLVSRRARVILMSHLGRPRGRRVEALSLMHVLGTVQKHLAAPVAFAEDCSGGAAKEVVASLSDGEVALLENLRFNEGETSNSVDFASKIAALGDAYVNDAFGTVHRAHASTDAVPRMMKERAAGYLVMRELEYLGRLLSKPERPFVAVLGGAKIAGKIDVVRNLLNKVDKLLIGGGMTFTFLKAQGVPVGRSLVEEDCLEPAAAVLRKAEGGGKLVLPVDCVVADTPKEAGDTRVVSISDIPGDRYGVDVGPQTVKLFADHIRSAKTVFWNGPLGIFEIPEYAAGTEAVAHAMAEASAAGATTVVGGGDSIAALKRAGVAERITHVSTGGGASLEFLAGKTLPGVAALEC